MKDVANDKEFKAKLKALGDMKDRGEISREKMVEETEKLYGNYGFFISLKNYIDGRVNYAIPIEKGVRQRFNEDVYAQVRSQKETQLIESENWKSTFEKPPFTKFDKPSSSDTEAVKAMSETDLLAFQQCVIRALKTLVDNHEETTPLAERLHSYYLLLHGELETHFEQLKGRDGFLEYIASREEREKEDAQYATARTEGNICIQCGSSNVHSKGKEWHCFDCGKRFSKHTN